MSFSGSMLIRDAHDNFAVVNPSLGYQLPTDQAAGKIIAGLMIKCIAKHGDNLEARRHFWQAVKDSLDLLRNVSGENLYRGGAEHKLLSDPSYDMDLAILKELFGATDVHG